VGRNRPKFQENKIGKGQKMGEQGLAKTEGGSRLGFLVSTRASEEALKVRSVKRKNQENGQRSCVGEVYSGLEMGTKINHAWLAKTTKQVEKG